MSIIQFLKLYSDEQLRDSLKSASNEELIKLFKVDSEYFVPIINEMANRLSEDIDSALIWGYNIFSKDKRMKIGQVLRDHLGGWSDEKILEALRGRGLVYCKPLHFPTKKKINEEILKASFGRNNKHIVKEIARQMSSWVYDWKPWANSLLTTSVIQWDKDVIDNFLDTFIEIPNPVINSIMDAVINNNLKSISKIWIERFLHFITQLNYDVGILEKITLYLKKIT